MENKKIVRALIILITIIIFLCNIIFIYIIKRRYNSEKYYAHYYNLLNYNNEQENSYKLKEKIQVNKSNNNIYIPAQDILKNSDDNIIGVQYSLDGVNYTSTIDKDYTFEYVKNIDMITSIYVKIIDKEYNEIIISQYCTDDYKYIPHIDMQISTKEYTNDSVYIVISSNNVLDKNYKVYYRINNDEYREYESYLKIENNNTKVTAIIYNQKEERVEKELEYTITNIDKISPSKPQDLDMYIKNNILYIKAIGSSDMESGILGFRYKVNNEDFSDLIGLDSYYTYEIQGENEFNIAVIAIDNVLNESSLYEVHYDSSMNIKY